VECICNPTTVNFSYDAHSFWGGRAHGDAMAGHCSRVRVGGSDYITTLYIGYPDWGPEEWGCVLRNGESNYPIFTICGDVSDHNCYIQQADTINCRELLHK